METWFEAFRASDHGFSAYERAGFKPIGRWREAYRIGDHVLDVIFMDRLATEFRLSVLARLLPDAAPT